MFLSPTQLLNKPTLEMDYVFNLCNKAWKPSHISYSNSFQMSSALDCVLWRAVYNFQCPKLQFAAASLLLDSRAQHNQECRANLIFTRIIERAGILRVSLYLITKMSLEIARNIKWGPEVFPQFVTANLHARRYSFNPKFYNEKVIQKTDLWIFPPLIASCGDGFPFHIKG